MRHRQDAFEQTMTAFLAVNASPDGAIRIQVTLQHDTLEGVVGGDAFYGSTVGRVCNRIGGATFSGVCSS